MVRVNGEIVAGYVLLLRGQAQPFVEHPRVVAKIADLTWQAGAAAMQRLTVEGPATIVDGSVTPPQRADFTTLTLQVDDTTWPVQRPVRLKSVAVLGTSGTSTFEGTFNPATLAADIRARFADLDVTRAGPYLPPDRARRDHGWTARGHGRAEERSRGGPDHQRRRRGGRARGGAPRGAQLTITDQRLAFAVDEVRVQGGALAIRRASLKGAPGFVDESVTPARERWICGG